MPRAVSTSTNVASSSPVAELERALFQAGKPLFIGLIVGEALTAGVWLLINLALAGMGMDYKAVILYPS